MIKLIINFIKSIIQSFREQAVKEHEKELQLQQDLSKSVDKIEKLAEVPEVHAAKDFKRKLDELNKRKKGLGL